MRIIYFLTNFPSYSETFIATEIEQIKEAGHTPIICNFTFKTKNQHSEDYLILNNTQNVFRLIRAVFVQIRNGESLFINLKFIRAIISSISKRPVFILKYLFMLFSVDYMIGQVKLQKAELGVNHFLFKSTLAGSFICERLNIPYHLRLHTKRYLYADTVLTDILKRASKITAIASDVKTYYEGFIPNNESIGVIRQSVDISFLTNIQRNPSENDFFEIIAIGRLIDKKGFNQLISAIGSLEKDIIKSCRIRIFGDGPKMKSLKGQIQEAGLGSTVFLMGKLNHESLMQELAKSDLLVVPSIELKEDIDGIPTVIIESMLMKTPVLAYDTASISEVIIPNTAGFLVEANDITSLSAELKDLMNNKARRESVLDYAYNNAIKEYKYTLAQELI